MSIRALNDVWESDLFDGSTLLVLLALADYANEDGWSWPSVGRIAQRARISTRAVRYATKALAVAGAIEIEMATGAHGTNRYRILPLQNLHPAKSAPLKHASADPPSLSDFSEGDGSGAKSAPLKRNVITDEFRQQMYLRFPSKSHQRIDDEIAAAIGHRAASKWVDVQAGVRVWLTRSFEEFGSAAKPTPMRPPGMPAHREGAPVDDRDLPVRLA